MKKIRLDPFQDIVEEMLEKEEGWIAELDSLQKEVRDKVLHLMEEDKKRAERHIKILEELRENVQGLMKRALKELKGGYGALQKEEKHHQM